MRSDRVSVIIPTHNGAKTISAAIDSIRMQEGSHEIIVVDDGSTDQTPQILEELQDILVIRQERRGPAAARNAGLERATAPLIAFLDDDDQWCKGKLAVQFDALATNVSALATIGQSVFVYTGAAAFEAHPFYLPGAVLVRREAFDRIGTFDESLAASEDLDWFLRFRDAGLEMVVTPGVVLYVRRDGENITHGKTLHELGIHALMKASLDRRRRRPG